MIGRVVEIAGDSRYLHKERGFLVVSHRGAEQGRVPLDDIAALICNAHGLVYSNNLLVALVERGCPIVLCGKNHMPAGISAQWTAIIAKERGWMRKQRHRFQPRSGYGRS